MCGTRAPSENQVPNKARACSDWFSSAEMDAACDKGRTKMKPREPKRKHRGNHGKPMETNGNHRESKGKPQGNSKSKNTQPIAPRPRGNQGKPRENQGKPMERPRGNEKTKDCCLSCFPRVRNNLQRSRMSINPLGRSLLSAIATETHGVVKTPRVNWLSPKRDIVCLLLSFCRGVNL